MPQNTLQLLAESTKLQSVLVSVSTTTDQAATLALVHQKASQLNPESLISLECIAPEKSSLGIPVVRNIQTQLRYAATAQRPRWLVLLAAHTLTVPAQNALLKTLEEPPPHTVLFLTTPYPDRLLPTITSRLVVLREQELTELLGTEIPQVTAVEQTGPTYAQLQTCTIAQALERAEEFGEKESAVNFLEQLLQEAHRSLQQTIQGGQQFAAICAHTRACVQALRQLEANCNVKLVMGELFLACSRRN